jgi:hypothetical protein
MRHLGSLIAAIVIAPAAWLLIAFGQTQSGTAFAKALASGAWPVGDFLTPLFLLAGAGILLGLIGTLRFSPLGALLAGLGYVASYVVLLFDGKDANSLLSYTITIASHKADLRTPVGSGATLLLGSLLLVSVVSVGRWRRWPKPVEPVGAESLEEATTEETGPFWPSPSPVPGSGLRSSFGTDEATTERVVHTQFGSAWRTPPGDTAEDQSR